MPGFQPCISELLRENQQGGIKISSPTQIRVNPFCNFKPIPDVYDPYNLLSNKNLLKTKSELIECFIDNYILHYTAPNYENVSFYHGVLVM